MESSLVVQGLGFRAFITAAPVQSLIWELGSNVKLLHAVAKKKKKEKKKKKRRELWEVPVWHRRLRIQWCHRCGAGCNCGVGFDPWPGNFHMLQA